MKKTVLIIDDELDLRELLKLTLAKMGIDSTAVETVKEAVSALQENTFDLCLTDMRLPDGNGLELVDHVSKNYPQLPIAVLTAYGNVDLAVDALKLGAFDFLSKPVELSRLRALITNALNLPTESPSQKRPSKGKSADNSDVSLLLGDSKIMADIRQQIGKVARSQAPMFISGESGTGKELAARSIHGLSSRAAGPFIPVNCGAIPANLVESEFFGHRKGSFTGAFEDKQGLFQAANGGTLFLDEVADLPLDMQVKLLRAIQEKRIRPVGSETEIDVDVRLISATHKNLQDAVTRGAFRSDLFYRLNVIDIHMPSLRQRPADTAILAEHILGRLNTDNKKISLSPGALNALANYSFPGNVRELENILERACTLCENSRIELEDLKLNPAAALTTDPQGEAQTKQQYKDIKTSNPSVRLDSRIPVSSLDDHLEEIEKEILIETLEKARWNKTEAAKKLGISFRSIRYRLEKLGLNDE
ncbi:MAG: sigma-54 dependent transcriptional regulator [Porticoccaceae bacterium]|nr:sigma-54 dependent transcriptional regulator [Porticoccaceae bacterium]